VDIWTFLFLMLALKIPIVLLFGIVWWAVHATPETAADATDDGGSKAPRNPHPRGPLPRLPRRGPHAEQAPGAPPRVRSVVARSRDNHHA
jgi:hypothetical protein